MSETVVPTTRRRAAVAIALAAGLVFSGAAAVQATPPGTGFVAGKGGALGAAHGCDNHAGKNKTASHSAGRAAAKPAPKPLSISIAGQPVVGEAVQAKVKNAGKKATLAYQWFADGTAIPDATGATFTPSSAELGKRLTAQVTKLNGSAKSKSVATASAKAKGKTKTSKPSAPVVLGVVTPSAVTLLGESQVGRVLVAVTDAAAWAPDGVTLQYQWYRGKKAIKGATGSEYVLTKADAGKKISVQVKGTASNYRSASKKSAAVKVAKGAGASTAVDKVACDLANWATRAAAILRTVNL